MSADNWAICPRCEDRRQTRLRERAVEVQAAYGSVSVEEFDRLRNSLATDQAVEPANTFREDYEFYGAEDGTVHAAYSGGCSECGLGVTFAHEHPFYPEATS